jgi:hypothetical protein
MTKSRLILWWVAALGWAAVSGPAAPANDSATIKRQFKEPPREYGSAPLWVWNDLLTEEQVTSTMRDLAGQRVKQVFVHPRPGLMTPYLSADWFRLWKTALREAEKLDMNVWIYDENSYPSGFAGGLVPAAMPEARGRGLVWREEKTPKAADNLLAAYRLEADRFTVVTEEVKKGAALPEGRYLVASVARAKDSPWHGGKFYVDLLYPGVTEKFLEITLGAYRREIGDQFGKRVPGIFTDEPELTPAGGLPWTDLLPEWFQKRWGYSLLDNLPSLRAPVGDWRKVRHDYYQLLLEQFIEHWGKPYHDWCAANKLEFTGHYWEHEWPNCGIVPDNMAMYAWHQRPAIDNLMNQYQENTHAQFGNARTVKELSSVANQMGYRRTLCEAYGAGGWDLRFEDMKRIGDWLYVLGVNTLDQHLSYITLRGARKRDHPQSFSYHEPWWDAYHYSAAYFERLSLVLSAGEQVNPVLVLEPTTTAWLYNSAGAREARLNDLGNQFCSLVMALESAQVEYDLGCEDIMARNAKPASKGITIGQRNYGILVLPPLTESVNETTAGLIERLLHNGGTVVACGAPPNLVEGRPSDRLAQAAKSANWLTVESRELPARLATLVGETGFSLTRAPNDKGLLFHHRRQLQDGETLFLVNTSITEPTTGTLASHARGIEEWNAHTGQFQPFAFAATPAGVKAEFTLPPSGSLVLFLARQKLAPAVAKPGHSTTIAATGPVAVKREEANVLVLDYADITAGGETRTNQYFYAAGQFAFRKNGMERNPWDSAVQFKDELITRTFPPGSGFEATFRFTIEGAVPAQLEVVVERPDLYTITCNGRPVTAKPGTWWLDKAFGRLDLTQVAQTGGNQLTLKASPFTIFHELEPVYIRGEFGLKPVGKGFAIVPDAGLKCGPGWNAQQHPFYSAGVRYTQEFEVASKNGAWSVNLPAWLGSVAKVRVNGQAAGYIAYAPWECDVTHLLKSGRNSVEVTVIGTLKNTLGPHHGKPGLGTAWPGMFQKGPENGPPPGKDYSTVGYGLFEPFVLKQRVD